MERNPEDKNDIIWRYNLWRSEENKNVMTLRYSRDKDLEKFRSCSSLYNIILNFVEEGILGDIIFCIDINNIHNVHVQLYLYTILYNI